MPLAEAVIGIVERALTAPIPEDLLEAARQACIRMDNDTRTDEEKLDAMVRFMMDTEFGGP